MVIQDISLFAFPVNLIIGVLLFCVAGWKKRVLSSQIVCISAFAAMLLSVLVLGFCHTQQSEVIIRSWFFALVMIWFLLVMAAAFTVRISAVLKKKAIVHGDLEFMLIHAGLWLVFFALYFGRCDENESVLTFWNITTITGIIMTLLGACLMLKEVKR